MICSISLLCYSNFPSHSVSSLFLARVWISTRWWKLATLSARRWIKPQTPKSPKPPSKLDLNEFRIWELKDSFQSQFVAESLMPTHSEVEVNLKKNKRKIWERRDTMKRWSLGRPRRRWKAVPAVRWIASWDLTLVRSLLDVDKACSFVLTEFI